MSKKPAASNRCKVCNKAFRSRKELEVHNKSVHGDKNYGMKMMKTV